MVHSWPCNVIDRPRARKLPKLDPNACGPSVLKKGVDGKTYYVHQAKTGTLSWKLAPEGYDAHQTQYYDGVHPLNRVLCPPQPPRNPACRALMEARFPCTEEDRPKARKLPKLNASKCVVGTRKTGVDGKTYRVKAGRVAAKWVLDIPVRSANKCLICDERKGGKVRRFIPGCRCPSDIKVCDRCFARHRVQSKNARCPWCRVAPRRRTVIV
jgi:hypothetical protein